MIAILFEPWPKTNHYLQIRVKLTNSPYFKWTRKLHLHRCFPLRVDGTFVFSSLPFLSMDGKKSSIPKGVFDMRAFSLKQMAEASESEG